MLQRRYDIGRGRRYKEWWNRQSGPPKGELIEIPNDLWTDKPAAPSPNAGDSGTPLHK